MSFRKSKSTGTLRGPNKNLSSTKFYKLGNQFGCRTGMCYGRGCNPGFDGALSKPAFLAPGSGYKDKQSMTAFFTRGRGGGGLKCGTPTRPLQRRAGAVHGPDREGSPARKGGLGDSRGSFRPAGGASGLFSRPSMLGPDDRPAVSVDPRAGGAMRTGKFPGFKREPAPRLPPASPIKKQRKATTNGSGKPFRNGSSKPSDFFDASLYDTEPSHSGRDRGRRAPTGAWFPGGKTSKPFGRYPDHLPDPYNGSHVRFLQEGRFYAKDGCMERAVKGGGFYVCLCWSRAAPPIEWSKEKVHDMYTRRVGRKGKFVYSIMPANKVPLSMSQRVGKPIQVE